MKVRAVFMYEEVGVLDVMKGVSFLYSCREPLGFAISCCCLVELQGA